MKFELSKGVHKLFCYLAVNKLIADKAQNIWHIKSMILPVIFL